MSPSFSRPTSNSILFLGLLAILCAGCSSEECPVSSAIDGGTASSFLRGCDPDAGCPGVTPPDPETLARIAVSIQNASAFPRYFNAGWGINTSQDPHPTGWLIPDEILAPGETRFFPESTIEGVAGNEVVIGVSGYYTPEPGAWARAEPRFMMQAGSTTCKFVYSSAGLGGPSSMTGSCAPTLGSP